MRLLPVLLAVGAVAVSAAPASAQQTAVPVACPATFSVLHDDRIGQLSVPAGNYALTVLDPARLSCAAAADQFRQSLEDWDGVLPAPWKLDAATATFSAGPRLGFRIAAASAPSGGGGGQYPATGARCPGFFQVLHDDGIGRFPVPAGSYSVTLLAVGPLSCAQAMSRFASFLQDFDGVLPSPWILDPETATFLRGSARIGFRIEPAAGPVPTPKPSGGGVYPEGPRCAGTFRVVHNDRIGRLRLPAGRYRITLAASGRPSCSLSARFLARFLRSPSGPLPRPWRLNPTTGKFSSGSGSGFRIKPAKPLR